MALASTHVKTKCTTCGKQGVYTLESRIVPSNGFRRRRKECCHCKTRTTTFEVPEEFYRLAEAVSRQLETDYRAAQKQQKQIKCFGCVHNNAERECCGFDLPEHMTSDANDCLYFNQA